ncbi:alpha-L-fucosidase [Desertivirga xinjiangensis]|uniref:alpha-L-fucosidase n=1 Tax=Desertivirga xinjiangensis TaxID=539206 RepID=UPI002109ED1D|nr:alpha-L-fucosidase [Pedobacter xinjiangensis]
MSKLRHLYFSYFLFVIFFLFTGLRSFAQQGANLPEREKWFSGLGFGMFIHWSIDSQLGAVISHSLAGASRDYREKFFRTLPETFNPSKFKPEDWAILAKLAGMKYVVFTAKHHAGFCMFKTITTPFNILNTPFNKDITREVISAFRKQGIAVGIYFSPEDFYFLNKTGAPVGRLQNPLHYPISNPALMEYDKAQLKELLTNYGKIDIIFLDGPAEVLKEYCWKLQPDIVVTRGQMNTPEQKVPDTAIPSPWETCLTMGTDWQYKPTNDSFKSGTELINILIETRAKGGNLLLNVGPKPDGSIREEEEGLLREIALWNFANAEAIHNTKAATKIREGNIWYTTSTDDSVIFAFITNTPWKYGERKEIVLSSLRGTAATSVEVLGYESNLLEYQQNFDASVKTQIGEIGLVVSMVNGQRFYTNNKWPNPLVLKIRGAVFKEQPATQVKKSNLDGAH